MSQDLEWTKAKGLHGGNVEAIAFASECEIYVGTVDAGLHFTSDCGETWQDLGFNFVGPNLSLINGLLVDDDGTVYMAINSRGVFRRDPDTGEWALWNSGLAMDQYDCLDKGIEGRPTICTRGFGLFQLMNGTTWEQLPDPSLIGADVRGFAINDSLLVIGTRAGDGIYFYNLDEERSTTIGSIGSNFVRDVHIDGEYVFAPTINLGIRMLNLRDTVWQTITTDLPTGQFQSVTTANGRVYAGTFGLGVFSRSIDLSDNWVRELNEDVTSNVLVNYNDTVYSGTGNGIYKYEDQSAFQSLGPEVGLVRSFEEWNGQLFVGTFDNGIWTSLDGGMNWKEEFRTSDSFFSIYADPSSNVIFAGTFDEGVFSRPLDADSSWKSIGLPFKQILDFFIAPNGDILVATNSGISRLANGSSTWISSELTSYRIRDFYSSSGRLYAITTEAVFVNTSPDETDWRRVSQINFSANAWSADGFENLLVINTPPDGLLSFDTSLGRVSYHTLPTLEIVDMRVVDHKIWLAADYRGFVYLTNDAGQTWEELPRSPEESRLRKIWVTEDGSILLGTESNGIFKSNPVIPASVDHPSSSSERSFVLYPNPASSNAVFETDVRYPQQLGWSIFDSLGRLVAYDQVDVTSGRNQVQIPLNELVAGLYIFSFSLDRQNIGGSKTFVVQ